MNEIKPYYGVVVPLITPFLRDFCIDKESLHRILENIIRNGALPFILGTTGEYPSLSQRQKEVLAEATVEQVAGRCPVFTGISGNCMEESIRDARQYSETGVDLLVASVPFYFPLDGEQSFRYFSELADRCPKPLFIYNIPLTTHFSIPVEVVEKLSHHPNIAGIKDSEPDAGRMELSVDLWKGRNDFSYLSGCSALSYRALKGGAAGIVPSSGNFIPGWYVELAKAVGAGESRKAETLQELTDQITSFMTKGRILSRSLPALKALMSEMGICQPWVLPPMYRMDPDEETEFRIRARGQLELLKENKKRLSG